MLAQRISVSSSVRIAVALCVVHIAATGLLWLAPIPVLGRAVFTLAIAVSLVYFLARDAALHASHAIVALELESGGGISLETRAGERLDCELLGSSYVSPGLTVINLRPRGRYGTRRVILVPDNVEPGEFRRLRAWLRWHGQGCQADQAVDR